MSQAGNGSRSSGAARGAKSVSGGGSGAAGGGAAGGGMSSGAAAAPPPPNADAAGDESWMDVVSRNVKKKAGAAGAAAPAVMADAAVSSTSVSPASSQLPADGFATAAGSANATHVYNELGRFEADEVKLSDDMEREMASLQAAHAARRRELESKKNMYIKTVQDAGMLSEFVLRDAEVARLKAALEAETGKRVMAETRAAVAESIVEGLSSNSGDADELLESASVLAGNLAAKKRTVPAGNASAMTASAGAQAFFEVKDMKFNGSSDDPDEKGITGDQKALRLMRVSQLTVVNGSISLPALIAFLASCNDFAEQNGGKLPYGMNRSSYMSAEASMWLTTMARAARARLQTSADYYSFIKNLITQGGTEATSLKFPQYATQFNDKASIAAVRQSFVYNINLWAHEVGLVLATATPGSWGRPGTRGLVAWNILASVPIGLSKRWKISMAIDSAAQLPHTVTWDSLRSDFLALGADMLTEENPEKLAEAIRDLLPSPKDKVVPPNAVVGSAGGGGPGGAAGGGAPGGGGQGRTKCTNCKGKLHPWHHATQNCPARPRPAAAIAEAAAPIAAGGAAANTDKCFRCADPAHKANTCPFINYVCKLCNGTGHKENCCREEQRKLAAAAAAAANAAPLAVKAATQSAKK